MTEAELNQAVDITTAQAQIVAKLLRAEGLTPRVRQLVDAHHREVRQLHDRMAAHHGVTLR
jgi:hypothetical protein